MDDCIFCKIVSGSIPSRKAYEDDRVYAFWDINPKAPVHILIIPKKHMPTVLDAGEEDRDLLGHILMVAGDIAREQGIAESGFRIMINCNRDGGQVVYHLHYHLLGGKQLD